MDCFPHEIIAGKCIFATVENTYILFLYFKFGNSSMQKKKKSKKEFLAYWQQ